MARVRKSIGELATDVLEQVEREQLEKTAGMSYTSKESQCSTSLGKLMCKVANELRTEAKDQSITYSDLTNFRKRYGV